MKEMKEKTVKKKTVGREILEWILTIVAAVAIALPLLTFSIFTNMLLQSIGEGVKASITSAARSI